MGVARPTPGHTAFAVDPAGRHQYIESLWVTVPVSMLNRLSSVKIAL